MGSAVGIDLGAMNSVIAVCESHRSVSGRLYRHWGKSGGQSGAAPAHAE
jgi:hypothetical protein